TLLTSAPCTERENASKRLSRMIGQGRGWSEVRRQHSVLAAFPHRSHPGIFPWLASVYGPVPQRTGSYPRQTVGCCVWLVPRSGHTLRRSGHESWSCPIDTTDPSRRPPYRDESIRH